MILQRPPWLTNESQWPTWNHSEVLHLKVDKAVIPEVDSATVKQSNRVTSSEIHNIVPASNYSEYIIQTNACISLHLAHAYVDTHMHMYMHMHMHACMCMCVSTPESNNN